MNEHTHISVCNSVAASFFFLVFTSTYVLGKMRMNKCLFQPIYWRHRAYIVLLSKEKVNENGSVLLSCLSVSNHNAITE